MGIRNRVLAVTDKGVILDAFDESSKEIPCTACVSHKEIVVYATEEKVYIYNAETEVTHSLPISKGRKMKISSDGKYLAVLTENKELYLVEGNKVVRKEESALSFSLSNRYLVYSHIVDTSIPLATPVFQSSFESSTAQSLDEENRKNNTITSNNSKNNSNNSNTTTANTTSNVKVTTKEGKNIQKTADKPVITIKKKMGAEVKEVRKAMPRGISYIVLGANKKKEMNTRAPLSFSATGGYLYLCRVYGMQGGEIEIWSLDKGKSLKKIRGNNLAAAEFHVDRKHGTERALCICTLNSTSTTYYDVKVLYYLNPEENVYKMITTNSPICDYTFLYKGVFALCHGNSPSSLTLYNSAGEKIKEMKKAVRNKLFFNRQENLVCYAGMNNLPGTLEITEVQTEAYISSNEMLGCSIVEWSPSGQTYLVGVTSRMSIDNCITLFDYYSRKISERYFSCLIHCAFIGKDEAFKSVESPPEKVRITKKANYVPPSMRTKNTAPKDETEWKQAYIVKNRAEEREKKIKRLLSEIEEIEEIERKMAQGQVVPGGILKIQKKEYLTKKLAHYKKSFS